MRSMMTAYGTSSSMRAASSCTSSAVMPRPRFRTCSMNVGGKDHSLPTISPILACIAFSAFYSASIMAADVRSHHLMPVRPIVCPAVPDPQRVADAFVPEHLRHPLVVGAHRIVSADGEDDVHAAQRLEPSVIVLIRDEVHRRMEVHVLV